MQLATHAVTIAAAITAALTGQAPAVLTTAPARHTIAGPFDAIRIGFSTPIAPATVNAHSFAVFGTSTGPVPGSIAVDTNGLAATFQPLVPLFVGDVIHVDLAASITSAAGVAMPGGFHFRYTVRSGAGSGAFQLVQTIPFRQPGEGWIATYGIHAVDLDRDGAPDLTAINEVSHDLRVLHNGGCADFGPMTTIADGQNWPSPHASADFDRDGWPDLVTGDYQYGNLSVFRNNGFGGLLPPATLNGNSYIRSVDVGDFNGDGYPDIVAGNGTRVLVWLNDGTGNFPAANTYVFAGAAELNVADVDGDGILDIIGASDSTWDAGVMIGNGDGTFTSSAALVPLGARPFQSAVADLNGDGHIDVAYCCLTPNCMVWLFGDGNGNFTHGGSLPAGSWPTSIHLADLDGDGDIDAVLSHYGSGDYRIYWNQGGGTFTGPVVLPGVSHASCTTIADFNRDGLLDIIGADEAVDVGLLFTQVGASAAGHQPQTCAAALRIDQVGRTAGFGAQPPVPVRPGRPLALSLSSDAAPAIGLVLLGFPGPSGLPLPPWGSIGLDPALPVLGLHAVLLDAHGELLLPLVFPPASPIGASLAFQGLVLGPGFEQFTNPVRVVLVP